MNHTHTPTNEMSNADCKELGNIIAVTNQKIQAVKLVKDRLFLGLKDSKDIIDNVCAKHRPEHYMTDTDRSIAIAGEFRNLYGGGVPDTDPMEVLANRVADLVISRLANLFTINAHSA